MRQSGPPGPPGRGRGLMGRPRVAALSALALLNVLAIGAGAALAARLPGRIRQWQIPAVAVRPLVRPAPVLAGTVLAGTSAGEPQPSGAGLAARLSGLLAASALGPHVSAIVADPATGTVLFSDHGDSPAKPASTAKLGTAVAALDTLGPAARFTTSVAEPNAGGSGTGGPGTGGSGTGGSGTGGSGPARIILVGGGDPTLTAGRPPAGGYPRPATLQALAAGTARALKAQHRTTIRLGYDTSLFSGPGLAPGWSPSYVSTGNVTSITSLEVDQGRLLPDGLPQDADVPGNLRPRSLSPAADAAAAFGRFLGRDGIRVAGSARPVTAARSEPRIARVSSPPLAAMVEQMLTESNNVIAENLARQVALATGYPASFAGGAQAVTGVLRKLDVATGVHLVDGSGLSPLDRIPAATLVQLVELAASAGHPALRAAFTGLPVAGFSGTLAGGESVFSRAAAAARGVVRAKTGNLDTVVTLAGLAYDQDGGVLAFAFMADAVPPNDLLQAAGAIDRMAATLTGCGCR
ncbi:MAG TPA: D-alanyl-D-alanine carboxypeptidase/D-alanyl-D-alanine-endopeptidase [Streptosporangiaceae bacterium]|nr:D-alanyl-D-alanine carboxypeptidase/D-alanyl-D-alanine-endopeptidase [Streptosporangiaceae bacterium]